MNRDLPATDLMSETGAWTSWSPREEIQPAFSTAADGGPGGRAALVISATGNPAVCGCWRRGLPNLVVDRRYRLEVLFEARGVRWNDRTGAWQLAGRSKSKEQWPLCLDALPPARLSAPPSPGDCLVCTPLCRARISSDEQTRP